MEGQNGRRGWKEKMGGVNKRRGYEKGKNEFIKILKHEAQQKIDNSANVRKTCRNGIDNRERERE